MVRIYCLTSINNLPADDFTDDISSLDDDIEESITFKWKKRDTPKLIENGMNSLNQYKLTEICIGYKFAVDSRKYYAMNIFRKDIGCIFIKMVPGAVMFEPVSSTTFDMIISTSKLFVGKLNYDLRVKVRCIKNTKVKGRIDREEEERYENYEKQIYTFCADHNEIQEAALQRIPFVLPHLSEGNVLRTKISDFRILIDLLCNAKTGCYANVGNNKTICTNEQVVRYNQKLKCLLEDETWELHNPRRIFFNKEMKDYINCTALSWYKVTLKDQNFSLFKPKKLESVAFTHVNVVAVKFLQQSLSTINSSCHLKYLILIDCNITELSDAFMKLLPISLEKLDMQYNQIAFISKHISRLKNLNKLNLAMNENLGDNGFQWEYLPSSIKELGLNGTNISKIPSGIKRLTSVEYLSVVNLVINEVSWKDISPSIKWLFVGGGDRINAVCLKNKNKLKHLHIRYAGLTEIDVQNLPSSIEVLNLSNNKLANFDSGNVLSALEILYLNNNILNSINWENLPVTLENLDISHNELENIGNMSHMANLLTINAEFNHVYCISESISMLPSLYSLKLNHNDLFELPERFEEFRTLQMLYLNSNNFNCKTHDLNIVIWKRLPPNLNYLEINNNHLRYLPCLLRNFNISRLEADNCNLVHVCPYLYSGFRSNNATISIGKNDKFKHFPFIPQRIYTSFANALAGKSEQRNTKMRIQTDNSSLKDSTKLSINKIPFDFDISQEENELWNCKCCACCGKETTEKLVKQIMVMDFELSIRKKKNSTLENESNLKKVNRVSFASMNTVAVLADNTYYASDVELQEYMTGEWKANIVTRICSVCLTTTKEKIKYEFEEYKKIQTDHFILSKMKKKKIQNLHEDDKEILTCDSSLLPNSQNNYSTAPSMFINYDTFHGANSEIDYQKPSHHNYSNDQNFVTEFSADDDIRNKRNDISAAYHLSNVFSAQNNYETFYPDQTNNHNANLVDYSYQSQPLLISQTHTSLVPSNRFTLQQEKCQNVYYIEPDGQTNIRDSYKINYSASNFLARHENTSYASQYSVLMQQTPYPDESLNFPSPSQLYNNLHEEQVPYYSSSTLNNDESYQCLPQCDHPLYSYNPPSFNWITEICRKFNLTFQNYIHAEAVYIHDLYYYSPYTILTADNDGHCGFKALSLLLTGNQNEHANIRYIIAKTIIENTNPNFENLPFFENSKSMALEHLKIDTNLYCPLEFWMSCVHLATAAYLFNCNILVKTTDPYGWRLYNSTTYHNGLHQTVYDPNLPSLLLDNSSGNHFDAVINAVGFIDL